MLGINECVRNLHIEIDPNGLAISAVSINGKKVDHQYLKVDKIGFEFWIDSEGYIVVDCKTVIEERTHSDKRIAAAALAGAEAAIMATGI